MPFVRVSPEDPIQVEQVHRILEATRQADDPDQFPTPLPLLAAQIRYGWDLEPEEFYLYAPDGAEEPIGVLELDMPKRDNRHLIWAGVTVQPEHRRRGHGRAMINEVRARAAQHDRDTIWVGIAEDDPGLWAFVEAFGFHYASHDARRRQVLADVDHDEVSRLAAVAEAAAAGYELERLHPPISDEILQQMIEVTAAINDAPMGKLTYEDEKFDLQRMQDIETARRASGWREYRIVARHRDTGEIGGHTEVTVHPSEPTIGHQNDTAVAKPHRGHRLGLLLKIDMMRWLAEAEPQLEVIETWNNVDNHYMITVNEDLGYRRSRTFATFELRLLKNRGGSGASGPAAIP